MRLLKRVAACWLLFTALTACQVDLYTGLSEREGNDIYAVLLDHGIPVTKSAGKDQTVGLSVNENDVAAAVDILRRHGYPRDNFVSLGEIFQKQGLISSPLEERVRFIYGLSQSISETLTQIDGVLTARVHIVMPQEQPLQEKPQPSSAAVFIKYQPGLGIEETIPKIKLIVQNSVQGLSYDKISVALFPAKESAKAEARVGPPLTRFLGIEITRDTIVRFVIIASLLVLLLIATLAGGGYLIWKQRRTDHAAQEASASD